MMNDVRDRLADLGSSGVTDPFESIYDAVFQLTMRGVGAKEIGDDLNQLWKVRDYFALIDSSFTPTGAFFPWFPSFAVLKRFYAGSKLYVLLDKIQQDRKREGRRENDPFQFLIDQGDELNHMITVRRPQQ